MKQRQFKSPIRALLTLRLRTSPVPAAPTTSRPPTPEPESADNTTVVEEIQTEFRNVNMADAAAVGMVVESLVKAACDAMYSVVASFSAPTQADERRELLDVVSEALADCMDDDFRPVSVAEYHIAPAIVYGFEDYIIFSGNETLFVVLWTDDRTLELVMLEVCSDMLWAISSAESEGASASLYARAEGILSWAWGVTCTIVSQSMAITAHSGDEGGYTELTRVEADTPREVANTLRREVARWELGVFSSASELLALYAAGAFEPEQVYKDARGSTLESFVVIAPASVLRILSEAR